MRSRCAWGHGRQRVRQLRRGGREIASAEKVGSGAGRSSGEKRFQPALVEGNRGAVVRGNCFLAARLRRGSLFALGWFDGQGGAGQKKERESRTRVFCVNTVDDYGASAGGGVPALSGSPALRFSI